MVMIDPPLLDPSLGDTRDSKDHGDSAQSTSWSNPGDPSLWWLSKTHEQTLCIRPPWHLVCLVVSVVRFSFHHGAMKYCDRKLKSRVHAISNRRMTWPRNRGSKWNGCIPGKRDSKPFLLALEDEMFKKSTNAIRSYHANAMCVLNPEQNEWVAVYVSVSSGVFRCLRKCEGKTFWDLSMIYLKRDVDTGVTVVKRTKPQKRSTEIQKLWSLRIQKLWKTWASLHESTCNDATMFMILTHPPSPWIQTTPHQEPLTNFHWLCTIPETVNAPAFQRGTGTVGQQKWTSAAWVARNHQIWMFPTPFEWNGPLNSFEPIRTLLLFAPVFPNQVFHDCSGSIWQYPLISVPIWSLVDATTLCSQPVAPVVSYAQLAIFIAAPSPNLGRRRFPKVRSC